MVLTIVYLRDSDQEKEESTSNKPLGSNKPGYEEEKTNLNKLLQKLAIGYEANVQKLNLKKKESLSKNFINQATNRTYLVGSCYENEILWKYRKPEIDVIKMKLEELKPKDKIVDNETLEESNCETLVEDDNKQKGVVEILTSKELADVDDMLKPAKNAPEVSELLLKSTKAYYPETRAEKFKIRSQELAGYCKTDLSTNGSKRDYPQTESEITSRRLGWSRANRGALSIERRLLEKRLAEIKAYQSFNKTPYEEEENSRKAPEKCHSISPHMSQKLMRRARKYIYEDIHRSGYHYRDEIGVEKNYYKAFIYYKKKPLNAGDANGTFMIGNCYYEKIRVEKDE
ncbi:hypothetical protein C2G38_2200910 [Gigaspora rosea]|uniref:Uncharacterized protein n=1 Tax=Gigaspora rosea TaxID=44941 RepID=A0A397UUE0_9GLOM|nr:hypothetical protein C2G38_2200910 [Gigaspora rosea]